MKLAFEQGQYLPAFKYELSGVKWDKITSLVDVQPGNHISYKDGYWIHAIVEETLSERQTLKLIRWSLMDPR